MLPPGHIAAGFLVTKAVLRVMHPNITTRQYNHLLFWGTFFSFAPDFDNFAAFALVKGFWYKKGTDSTIHRRFYSHIPLLWLLVGLIIYFFSSSAYFKLLGLLVWIGSWTHFVLDSIDYGVMWLWPFNRQVWALRNRGIKVNISADGFFAYWVKMLKLYSRRLTFYAEILILIIFLIVYIH